MDKIVNMEKDKTPQFEDFKIGDLFEIKVGKQPSIDNRYSEKEKGMVNTITGVTINNGIGFYSYPDKEKVYRNILTMSKDGYAGVCYYQKQESILGGHSIGLIEKETMSLYSKLYISSILNKLQKVGRWEAGGVMGAVQQKALQNTIISLPVISPGVPDWDYMENYIKEVEQGFVDRLLEENIKEISQLKKLVDFENIEELNKTPEFEDFKIGELFEITTGGLIDKELLVKGKNNTDRVSVTTMNNGILGSFSSELNPQLRLAENYISVNFMGNVFYHKEKCSNEIKVHILKNKHLNKHTGLYLVSVLNKFFKGKYGYGNQLSSSMLKTNDFFISLPVISSGVPDWNYMENYIRIIEKNYRKELYNYERELSQ